MKQNKIFALVKFPNKTSEIRLIDKDLKAFNTIIDGKREIIPFPDTAGVCIIFDGKAAESKKKPNCFLPEYNDLVSGAVLFVGIDNETGFLSLTEEQADKLEQYVKANDAGGFTGNVEERTRNEYLSNTDETYIFSFLSEVKTKYKTIKVKWLQKR